jgi:hypothetical protein
MNKEVIITASVILAGVAVLMIVRDNLPKQSFSFKKG